ncbi:hypothetical protein D3C75_1095710 [compost metagenome]
MWFGYADLINAIRVSDDGCILFMWIIVALANNAKRQLHSQPERIPVILQRLPPPQYSPILNQIIAPVWISEKVMLDGVGGFF